MAINGALDGVQQLSSLIGKIANAKNTADGLVDAGKVLAGDLPVEAKKSLGNVEYAVKEFLSITAVTLNTALSPVMNANLRTFDGTKTKELEENLAKRYEEFIKDPKNKKIGEVFNTLSKANEAKNTLLLSPAASAAASIVIPLAAGTMVGGPAGFAAAASLIAVDVARGSSKNNAVEVKIDEMMHLQDYVHAKEMSNYKLKELQVSTGINSKEIGQIIGLKYEKAKQNTLPEEKAIGITAEKLITTTGKNLGLSMAETMASNLINSGALVSASPHTVAINLARLTINCLAGVTSEISNDQAKTIIDDRISDLRKEGPNYKVQKEKEDYASYRRLTNKAFNAVRIKLGLPKADLEHYSYVEKQANATFNAIRKNVFGMEEVQIKEPEYSRKYDLANEAMKARANAEALNKLAESENFKKNLLEYKKHTEGSKEREKAHQEIINEYIKVRSDVYEELKAKNPLYTNEKTVKPNTTLGKISRNLSTGAKLASEYLMGGNKSYYEAYKDLSEKWTNSDKQISETRQKHIEIDLAEKEKARTAKKLKEAVVNKEEEKRSFVGAFFDTIIGKKNKVQEEPSQVNPKNAQSIEVGKNTPQEELNKLVEKIDNIKSRDHTRKNNLIEDIRNCSKDTLSLKVSDGGKEVSLLEYAAKRAGSKVTEALLEKGDFTKDVISKAMEAAKNSDKLENSQRKNTVVVLEKAYKKATPEVAKEEGLQKPQQVTRNEEIRQDQPITSKKETLSNKATTQESTISKPQEDLNKLIEKINDIKSKDNAKKNNLIEDIRNSSKETLALKVNDGGKEVSLLEYAAKRAGSKVTEALVEKGDFTKDTIKKAMEAAKNSDKLEYSQRRNTVAALEKAYKKAAPEVGKDSDLQKTQQVLKSNEVQQASTLTKKEIVQTRDSLSEKKSASQNTQDISIPLAKPIESTSRASITVADARPVDRNVTVAVPIESQQSSTVGLKSVIDAIDKFNPKAKNHHEQKLEIVELIKKSPKEELSRKIEDKGRQVSILEYAISKGAGSKVVEALIEKGKFSKEELESAKKAAPSRGMFDNQNKVLESAIKDRNSSPNVNKMKEFLQSGQSLSSNVQASAIYSARAKTSSKQNIR